MSLDFSFYSPEEELNLPLLFEKNIRLFVKRDDLIHPYISGNKWRKLKYMLQKARKNHQNQLVTFGGAWSNHLLATACAGAKFGFQTHGFVRGDMVENPVLSLCKLYGMKLQFVSREDYLDKNTLFRKHFDENNALFIDEGGYGKEAMKGCAEIVEELKQDYDHIVVACGTGTTVAGLLRSVEVHDKKTTIHGVPVLKGGDFIANEVQKLGVDSHSLKLHTAYHFGGYAKINPDLIDFIKQFVSQTGVMIEPTYTGKVFYATLDLIKRDFFRSGERILIIHTGGLTGFLGMYQKF